MMVLSSLFHFKKSLLLAAVAAMLVGLFTATQLDAQDTAIRWYSMQEAQKLAKENGKKVLIFTEASWCVYCKKMKQEVFPLPAVIDSMNTYFYPVSVDIESDKVMVYNGKKVTENEFAQSTGMQATPTFFFLSGTGEKLGAQPGFIPAKTFSRLLGFIGSGAFKKMEFQKYLKQHASN